MSRISFISLIFLAISIGCLGIMRLIFSGWVDYMWYPVGLSLVFLAVILFRDFSTIVDFLSMKTTKSGLNMGLMILLVTGIIAMINFIGARNSISIDVTSTGLNSLSPQSVKILGSLDEEIKFYFFYNEGDSGLEQERAAFRELIRKYQDASPRTQLEYVKMNERPDLTEEFEVEKGGGVVFVKYKGRRNRIDKITEQEITQSIIKVLKTEKTRVYFVQGHGEADIYDTKTVRGMASLRGFLEGNQYEVKTLNILEKGKVPKDADVVAVMGPIQPLLTAEATALEEYLARGGNLFIAIDPEMNHGLKGLFTKLGIAVDPGYVGNMVFGKIRVPETIGEIYSPNHQITKVFRSGTRSMFQYAAPLKALAGKSDFKVEQLVKSGPGSGLFDGPTSKRPTARGPFSLILGVDGKMKFKAPEGFDTEGFRYGESDFRAVIAGDTDFLRNQLVNQQTNNHDLALNSFAYLAGHDDLISIRPAVVERTKHSLTKANIDVYKYAFIFPLTLLLLALSVVLAIRRRHA